MTESNRVQLISPYDLSPVGEVARHTDQEIDHRLDRARQSQAKWRQVPLEQRIEIVQLALKQFEALSDKVCRDISLQMGKPLAQSQGEFNTMLSRAVQSIADAPEALAPDVIEASAQFSRQITHVPCGVVLDIAAWNYPLLIPINVIVPALLAGNVVLLKHSDKTTLTGLAFEQAFSSVGETVGAPHLLQALTLDHDKTAAVIADRRVDHVVFTGSVPGGHAISRAAVERFVDVGLELGGKDAAYVAADADLEFAVENLVDGACYNAGQSCCGIERVYVHESHAAEFIERAATLIAAYRMGDPLEAETTLGPLAAASAPAFLQSQVDQALASGARLVAQSGNAPETGGYFFPATLLDQVAQDSAVMQEESFGPLLPVIAVASDEEAVRLMNDSQFGLTASVWTKDAERADALVLQLNAGTVFQNRCDFVDPALPWTGWGDSGRGSSMSRYGYYHLTKRKGLHLRRHT